MAGKFDGRFIGAEKAGEWAEKNIKKVFEDKIRKLKNV